MQEDDSAKTISRKNMLAGALGFWLIAGGLFLLAVGLRWYRLDLMTFRFDQAEVASRAREALRAGLPWTGIVNSLGFRNASGFIWTILPPLLLSPDPRWATAWLGLLSASAVFPMALLGRRFGAGGMVFLPACLMAALPMAVFHGRNLWAQSLLIPVAAWSLYWLILAMDSAAPPRRRAIAAAGCLAMLAWGVSIHFSAAPYLAIAGAFIIWSFRSNLKTAAMACLPALVLLLTLIPSLADWRYRQEHPLEKPDYVLQYESVLPPPPPLLEKLREALIGSFQTSSIEAVYGIQSQLNRASVRLTGLFDVLVWALAAIGCAAGVLMIVRRRSHPPDPERFKFACVLLIWLLLPAIAGAMLLPYVSMYYFLAAWPAAYLLPLLIRLPRRWRGGGLALSFLAAAGGSAVIVVFLHSIGKNLFVDGPYYIPYAAQARTAEHLHRQGIAAGRITHISGEWYERSYDYIHQEILKAPRPAPGSGGYALMEDRMLRRDQPDHMAFYWSKDPAVFGTVGVLTFDSRREAHGFLDEFYAMD